MNEATVWRHTMASVRSWSATLLYRRSAGLRRHSALSHHIYQHIVGKDHTPMQAEEYTELYRHCAFQRMWALCAKSWHWIVFYNDYSSMARITAACNALHSIDYRLSITYCDVHYVKPVVRVSKRDGMRFWSIVYDNQIQSWNISSSINLNIGLSKHWLTLTMSIR